MASPLLYVSEKYFYKGLNLSNIFIPLLAIVFLLSMIENHSGERLSVRSIPSYLLSSSLFIFPNRHILSLLPNVTGYNPLILKRYYDFLSAYSAVSAKANYDFDNLFIPFRCVSSDIVEKKYHVFKEGHLNQAVRASMTYPGYFKPLNIDGDMVFTGVEPEQKTITSLIKLNFSKYRKRDHSTL